MKIEREKLLSILHVSSVGITKREILEQSNHVVFDGDNLVTFNGEIFTTVKNPLEDVTGAVPAEDLMRILAKFPDEEIEIFTKGEEIRIKGKRRVAGLTRAAEIHLPYADVPEPDEWKTLPPELLGTLIQASRVCGSDETQPRTTEVNVTPNGVEACDNFRMFRSTMETGLDKNLLIPRLSIDAIGGVVFTKMSLKGGWLHLRTKSQHRVSIRCSSGDYPDLTPLLKMVNPRKVQLPRNLPDILARAEVMHGVLGTSSYEGSFDSMVSVEIAEGEFTLRARKEGGWFKESRAVEYKDAPLKFDIHPTFLQDILAKTRTVWIGGSRMKIKAGTTVFLVCLELPAAE